MCGPVQAWLLGSRSGLVKFSIYHLGRIFTYSIFGFLLGWIGISSQFLISQEGLLFLLLALALFVLFAKIKGSFISQFVIKLHSNFQRRWDKYNFLPGGFKFLFLGLINALLPCGLVYGALVLATAISAPLESMFFMVLFGLGTVPTLMIIHFAGRKLSLNSKYTNSFLLPGLNILVIAALLYRVMQSEKSQEMLLKAAADFATMCGF